MSLYNFLNAFMKRFRYLVISLFPKDVVPGTETPTVQNRQSESPSSLFCDIFDSGNGRLVLSLFSHLL